MFKTAAGYFFFQLCLIGFVINMGVLVPLRRVQKNGDKNCVYLIAIVTILNDNINLLVNLCYFAPSIISDSYILADSPEKLGPMLMTRISHFSWYNTIFVMIVMALNRMTLVVLNKPNIFTKQRVLTYFFISSILSFSKVVFDVFLIPCCLVLMDHKKYGWTYYNPKNIKNWGELIDTIMEVGIFTATLLCYVIIFIKIRISNNSVEQSIDSKHFQKLRARERSVAVQFALVSIFSIISFASFKVVPMIFGKLNTESNIISPICFAVHCCANGCIYMFMNEEVKDELLKKIFKHNVVHTESNNPNGVPAEDPQLFF